MEQCHIREHACRLREPGDFEADSFRRVSRDHEGKKYDVIMGRLKGEDSLTEQAYRYAKDAWEADDARAHCQEHDGSFEPAADERQRPARAGRAAHVREAVDLRVRGSQHGLGAPSSADGRCRYRALRAHHPAPSRRR
jgi:hypothetical protein